MKTVMLMPAWLTNCFSENSVTEKWLQDFQEQHMQAFLQKGIPTRRNELWKYTDVTFLLKQTYKSPSFLHAIELRERVSALRLKNTDSIILVFVNGHFAEELSETSLLPKTVQLCSLHQALATQKAGVKEKLLQISAETRHPFASMNAALFSDGAFLQVPKNTCIKAPVHLLYLTMEADNAVISPRTIIQVGENSSATILEEYIGEFGQNYFTNTVTDIYAETNAHIDYLKIQNESFSATHIANINVQQEQDSSVQTHSLDIGSRLCREDVSINLNARGAECRINGFYCLSQDNQHVDNHIQIDHLASLGTSSMIYKGILDKKSRAVYNGKIFVHKDAQKTKSSQENHNLLLSPDSEVDTKPEFEIYADDVKCAHGDTVGQVDDETLFYLRSRGIHKKAALKLLHYAFAADVMNSIVNPQIKQRMNNLLNEKLAHAN
jgi:Fe-S cluster assembly protein SufD